MQWFWTTSPDLTVLGDAGLGAAQMFVDFETAKRATMLTLALQAYRLEHGELPSSLSDLVPKYFDELPIDPYSHRDFVYFPSGIPEPSTDEERGQFNYWSTPSSPTMPNVPCVWSPGATLRTMVERQIIPGQFEADGITSKKGPPIVYYLPRDKPRNYNLDSALPKYSALAHGWWFPIPEQQK